jgi:hypothetical protein
MGTMKIPRLSDSDVIARYQAGESRGMIALRAGKTDGWVLTVLTRAGIPIRTSAESMAFAMRDRKAFQAHPGKRVVEFAPGTTGRRRRA